MNLQGIFKIYRNNIWLYLAREPVADAAEANRLCNEAERRFDAPIKCTIEDFDYPPAELDGHVEYGNRAIREDLSC